MRILLHPIFVVAVILAAVNQLLERQGIYIPVVHSYLDDLLCFPLVLTIGLAVYRIILPQYTLSPWHIWPLFAIYGFVFEWYLPQTSPVYTSDPLDLLAYFMGILIFQRWINREPDGRPGPLNFRSQKG